MAIIGPVHDGKAFMWHKGVGVAAISDMSRPGDRRDMIFGRLYDDACDVGFAVRSHLTGKLVAFYLDREDRDGSGEDIYGWNFLPVDLKLRDAGYRILIIND